MRNVNDLYRALVTEWTDGAVPALGATAAPTRLDDLGFADRISEPSHRMMLLDGVTYLPDNILVKVDRAAMAVSLETRVPMLDHRVADAAWRLPMSMKVRDGRGKWALRQILYRHVPRELSRAAEGRVRYSHWAVATGAVTRLGRSTAFRKSFKKRRIPRSRADPSALA